MSLAAPPCSAHPSVLKRRHALLLLLLFWSAIFLPGLGSTELKGEEGRRILPAVTMLASGDWIVPYVGGVPFPRKPPLVNWLIALSLKTCGVQNEWAARLPSVLSLLALGATIIAGAGPGWMSPATALVAAILSLTPAAVLDKGRLAEIDAIYMAISGIAIVIWLSWWAQRRSPWPLWLLPAIFLGLGALAKAPLHLLFYYAIVIAVLWRARELKQLLHPAHWVSLAIVVGIFALWAVPYFRREAFAQTTAVWQHQFTGRVASRFDFVHWATTIPRALLDQLPWLLFAPLLWRQELTSLDPRRLLLFRSARLAILLCFFGLLLLPGMLPRYTLPLLPPFACLLALTLAEETLAPPSSALRWWWWANSALASLLFLAAIAAPIAVAIAQKRGLLKLAGNTPEGFARLCVWPVVSAAGALAVSLVILLRRRAFARPSMLASASAGLLGAGMFLYAGAAIPFITRADNVRPVGAAVNETVPPGETLYLYAPEYLPAIFYLRAPYTYVQHLGEIPAEGQWMLLREERRKKLGSEEKGWEVVSEIPAEHPQVAVMKRVASK